MNNESSSSSSVDVSVEEGTREVNGQDMNGAPNSESSSVPASSVNYETTGSQQPKSAETSANTVGTASKIRRRIMRIGMWVVGSAAALVGSGVALESFREYSNQQAIERRTVAITQQREREELNDIQSIKERMQWASKYARGASAYWRKNQEKMDRGELEESLRTMKEFVDGVKKVERYERKNGRVTDLTMYYVLDLPEIEKSVNELGAVLQSLPAKAQ